MASHRTNIRLVRGFLVAASLHLVVLAPPVAAQTFDVIVRNGRVLDGTGNPAFRADVGIVGDRIAAIGDLAGATAMQIITGKRRADAQALQRDEIRLNRHRALDSCLSMIFSENRFALFRIMI